MIEPGTAQSCVGLVFCNKHKMSEFNYSEHEVQLVIILSLALLILGLCENFFHQRNLRTIPIRILVNGTRGKSSVTRLIAGALREAGYRTIAKTTGSEAMIILEDGTEIPVKRPLGPRITEQKALAGLAVRHHADALVVECMAVRAESQLVLQRHLLRSTIGVITNVRVDHIDEMGKTLEETASALSFAIPKDGTLVTTDPRFAGKARRVALVDTSKISAETLERFPYPSFAENVALACQVAEELGIDREVALRGMVKAKPDIGVLTMSLVESPSFKAIFINGFCGERPAFNQTGVGGGRRAPPSRPSPDSALQQSLRPRIQDKGIPASARRSERS